MNKPFWLPARTAISGACNSAMALSASSIRMPSARALACLCCAVTLHAQQWPVYGGDAGGSKYSTLTQINATNVKNLKLAWTWKTGETGLPQFKTRPGNFETSPLMIDGVLYLSTPYNSVVALDAQTGKELWKYETKAYEDGPLQSGVGFVHRGVAAWRDEGKLRLFMNSRSKLICLDAETGQPVAKFGDNGIVNLVNGLRWPTDPKRYLNTSPAVLYKNLVIVGNGVGDRLTYKQDPPGDVRAFDAHNGKLAWTFHTVPMKGEPGVETWEQGSEAFTGHANVWAPFTVDAGRGLVYLPVSTPSNDFYGGRRPGQNLYADSIVCLDANTGKLRWYHQLVHHGLWDYDTGSPPMLVTINPGGVKTDVVVQLTKMGFVYVFDRVTGKPIWPIEERKVPESDVPGEHAWPTQPFPTKPVPLSEQGVTLDDAFDLTPELKEEAKAQMMKYRLGPLFTPPSIQGTLMRPSASGGANWGGGAFDPETGMLYVKTSNNPTLARLKHPERTDEVDADYATAGGGNADFHDHLPLLKPPYAYLSAVNLNTGGLAWREVFGDMPRLRTHPALQGVTLPEKFGAPTASGEIVTKGGIVFAGAGDQTFYAVDKSAGIDLWAFPLTRNVNATPVTYLGKDGHQYVVIATGSGSDAVLMAFSLAN
jgi:quinoprotein glucose dehydrogenase